MGVSKYNSEGYHDPVPAAAVNHMEKEQRKWRPLIYVCSPYSGDVTKNVAKARAYSRFAVDQGAIPMAPHLLLPQYMSDKTERELAMFMDLVLMSKCEEVWVFGHDISPGMEVEIKKAKKRQMKIRYFTEDMKEEH